MYEVEEVVATRICKRCTYKRVKVYTVESIEEIPERFTKAEKRRIENAMDSHREIVIRRFTIRRR